MEMAKRSNLHVAPDVVAAGRDLMQDFLTFGYPKIEIGTPLYNRSFLSIKIDELPCKAGVFCYPSLSFS